MCVHVFCALSCTSGVNMLHKPVCTHYLVCCDLLGFTGVVLSICFLHIDSSQTIHGFYARSHGI